MTDPVLLIGGGPAALAAARAYREAGGHAPLVLVTDDDRPPYRRPPLTKEYLRGELPVAELQLESGDWYARNGVDLVYDAVVTLDPAARRVTTAAGRELRFARALLATGAAPQRLPVPGADDPDVRLMRRVIHADGIAASVTAGVRVAVIGSGFIGCEAASSLARRGAAVTLVSDERAPQATRLGDEVGARLAAWLADDGVALALGDGVRAFTRTDGSLQVLRESAGPLDTDLVVLGAGVAPRDELARDAGLALGPDDRHIRVDATMATSAPGVWAAGDVTVADHAVAGRPLHVEHWGDALAQGAVAGRAMAGDGDARWADVPGFWSTIGDRTLKHAAWGDGHDTVEVTDHAGGAFTARQYRDGRLVGVLTHDRDADYEAGRDALAAEADG